MRFSPRTKITLFAFLIILNILLRIQVVPHEIGYDSFTIHIMTNSLSEFGYAKWILHPLSLIGYFPMSEASSVFFLVSGLFQTIGLEMEPIIFIYSIFIGILSGFAAYLFAGVLIRNDLFKFLVALGFSTSGALLDLTTWTMGTRGLLVVMAPLLLYLLLKTQISRKNLILTLILSLLLLATHRMFAYLIPFFASFILTILLFKLKKFDYLKIPVKLIPITTVAGFFAMFSLPFFFRKFLEAGTKYDLPYESYVRYTGIFTFFALSGIIYLILKQNKSFQEWFLLLNLMFFTAFIYQQTYFKYFIQIAAVPVACIGLLNVTKIINEKKIALYLIMIIMITSISFFSYYQFLHDYREGTVERYIEDSTYLTGRWIRDYEGGVGISNDRFFGLRTFATSETVKQITPFTMIDYIYGFIDINMSQYQMYSITSEEFWYDTSKIENDPGEGIWYNTLLDNKKNISDISYIVENIKAGGRIIWHHSKQPSSTLLQYANKEGSLIYSIGNARVWKIN